MKVFKRDKVYEFSYLGLAEKKLDTKKKKEDRRNTIISIGVLIGLACFGLLGRDFLIIYVVNLGVTGLTRLLIG